MSSNPEINAQESAANISLAAPATTSSNTQTTTSVTENNTNNNDGEMNTSIGSNRSLNRIFFPSFRISRDMILNNVSHVQCQKQLVCPRIKLSRLIQCQKECNFKSNKKNY